MSYLRFEERGLSPSGKTQRWAVINTLSGTTLGTVQWVTSFRKYGYESRPGIVYDTLCLSELATFLASATEHHRTSREVG